MDPKMTLDLCFMILFSVAVLFQVSSAGYPKNGVFDENPEDSLYGKSKVHDKGREYSQYGHFGFDDRDPDYSLSPGQTVGVIAGSVFAFLVLCLGCCTYYRRLKRWHELTKPRALAIAVTNPVHAGYDQQGGTTATNQQGGTSATDEQGLEDMLNALPNPPSENPVRKVKKSKRASRCVAREVIVEAC